MPLYCIFKLRAGMLYYYVPEILSDAQAWIRAFGKAKRSWRWVLVLEEQVQQQPGRFLTSVTSSYRLDVAVPRTLISCDVLPYSPRVMSCVQSSLCCIFFVLLRVLFIFSVSIHWINKLFSHHWEIRIVNASTYGFIKSFYCTADIFTVFDRQSLPPPTSSQHLTCLKTMK